MAYEYPFFTDEAILQEASIIKALRWRRHGSTELWIGIECRAIGEINIDLYPNVEYHIQSRQRHIDSKEWEEWEDHYIRTPSHGQIRQQKSQDDAPQTSP